MKKYFLFLGILFLFIICYQNWNKTKNFGSSQGEFIIYPDKFNTNQNFSDSTVKWFPPTISDYNSSHIVSDDSIKNNNLNDISKTIAKEDDSKSLLGIKITINPGHHAVGGGIIQKEYTAPRYELKGLSYNTKAGASNGTSSCINKEPEGVRTLHMANLVMSKLSKKGADVILLDTSISRYTNKQRAIIANNNGSDLILSLHYDSNNDSEVRGSSVLALAKNEGLYQNGDTSDGKDWNRIYNTIIDESIKLANYYQQAISSDSNYKVPYRATSYRTDITGLNWSLIPTFYIELGFMSNPKDDLWLIENEDLLSDKIVTAIDAYFNSKS